MDIFLFAKATASLAATLALLLGLAWAWKRWGHALGAPLTPAARRLTVRETLRVSPTCTLHLIALDGREKLIAVTGTQVTVLDVVGDALSPSPPARLQAKVRG